MTEETEKLFNAPWRVVNHMHVVSRSDDPIGVTCDEHNSKRLARLPELYDALAEVMYEGCGNCCRAHDPNLDPTFDRFMDEGCPFNQRDCFFGQHWAILRKVRAGE